MVQLARSSPEIAGCGHSTVVRLGWSGKTASVEGNRRAAHARNNIVVADPRRRPSGRGSGFWLFRAIAAARFLRARLQYEGFNSRNMRASFIGAPARFRWQRLPGTQAKRNGILWHLQPSFYAKRPGGSGCNPHSKCSKRHLSPKRQAPRPSAPSRSPRPHARGGVQNGVLYKVLTRQGDSSMIVDVRDIFQFRSVLSLCLVYCVTNREVRHVLTAIAKQITRARAARRAAD